MKNYKLIFATALFSGLFGCVSPERYNAPNLDGECVTLAPTKTVQAITSTSSAAYSHYTADDIIEAYVTSSDEGGNFYKSISFVSTDGIDAFSMPIDDYNLYTSFEPGRKVYIKLKDRYFDKENGSTVIGSLYNNDTPANGDDDKVGRISGIDYKSIISASCSKVNENEIVNRVSVLTAKNDAYLNKLIEFDNVQFKPESFGKTYYDATLNDLGGATNHNISDEYGNTIIFRVSSYANFAGNAVPQKSGKIRGVLTKFGSDYQFLARTERDIKLTNELLTIDFSPPLGGSALVYSGSFTENFESYGTTSPGNKTFPKYINDPVIGTRYWENRTYASNKYIQMSSFGGTAENNRSLFIVPVNMTAANTFSFKSKSGFTNGNVLKVYYSTNYIPGTNVNNATLVDITSSFTISPGLSSGYPTAFTNSGNYNIPARITGNGYFIFEYVGSGISGITSTLQIDDVVVNE